MAGLSLGGGRCTGSPGPAGGNGGDADVFPVDSLPTTVDLQLYRHLTAVLPASGRRLVVLTGARQVGKTTLARATWPEVRYLNLDSVEDRDALQATHTAAWGRVVGDAVIDEAQKLPEVFEKVKYAYDAGEIDLSVLTGSARFLLMEGVRESLAGRAFIFELWPLMACELAESGPPLLDRLVTDPRPLGAVLAEEAPVLLGDEEARRREAVDHLGRWGGMPELLRLDDEDRRRWLRSYQATFFERDLADLVRLSDLRPFRTLQELVMLRTGQLVSWAELGRDAGLSAGTARQYLEYLRISYQAVLLRPFHRNLTSAVVKAPKVYWTDLGTLRHGTQQWGRLDGALFETLIVMEIHKWLRTRGRDVRLSFYRTRSGMEVDLMLDRGDRVLAAEIKQRATVTRRDTRGLRSVAEGLGSEWGGGLVIYGGRTIEQLDAEHDLWAVPAHRLL